MTNKRTRRTQVVRQLVCEELKEYNSNSKWNSIQRATREISFE